jgi:hypothetical protein
LCKFIENANNPNFLDMNCDRNENIDLKQVFIKLSINLENKNFGTFSLNNTAVIEIPENGFGNITFQSIEVKDAYNLSLIHKNAFNNSNDNLLGFSSAVTRIFGLGGPKKPFFVTNEFNCIKIDNNAIFLLQ